jgi:hypothetical protein
VPDRRPVGCEANVEQRLDDHEEARKDLVFGKVLLDFLFGEGVASLQQLLGDVGDIPRFHALETEFARGKGTQVGDVPFAKGPRLVRQVAQEVEYLRHRFGHLRHQRHFRVVAVTKELGFFAAQFENAADQGRVVEFGGSEFGGAGRIGAVERRAQAAAVGVLHDRQIRGHVQRELPAAFAVRFGGLPCGLPGVVRQSGELGFVAHPFGKGVGGVEQVLGKAGRELREFFGNRLEARLVFGRQLGAAEAKIAQFVVDDLPLGGRQAGVFAALGDCLVLRKEREVLSDFSVETRDIRQHAVVGIAPGGGVVDRAHMVDHSPGARQSFEAIAERCGEICPGRGDRVRSQALDEDTALREQLADCRLHVARAHGVEAG